MNRLAQERSPYLRHAAGQPIDWHPWSDEAFERAKREGKPVFLSSGGVWCHWCHVMAKESFEDKEVARLLNDYFISVKIDRDERPDLDRRYQQAVAAMGGGSGWPLSVFLTPERKAFFGGTYFPPTDMQGRPGFKNVLRAVERFYHEQRQDAEHYAGRVMKTLSVPAAEAGALLPSMLETAHQAVLAHFDPQNGGFGTAPKFPMPGAMEFLIHRYAATRDNALGRVIRASLDAMARGGVHDQLAGGFHRYSTDAAWIVPHFEKMADDNAWLLRNYAEAFGVFGEPLYREVAEGIIRFARQVLSDPAGGFFASQDADVTPDAEGGYFTWTDDAFRKTLTADEREVLSRHLLHSRGSMQHDAGSKVLFVAMTPEDIARELDRPLAEIAGIIRAGKEKLLAERSKRETPFIDRTFYTSLNGMFITSFLRASRVLGDDKAKDFALLSLGRVLRERFIDGELFHSVGIAAFLDDYVYIMEALIEAYETTAKRLYIDLAEQVMKICIERFADADGGFFDTASVVLGTRLKRVEDVPHPSANAVAAVLLLRLHHITGNEKYFKVAEKDLEAFSGSAGEYGIHAGAYFSALDAWFNMLRLLVDAGPESELAFASRSLSGRATVVVYGEDRGQVVPCYRKTCYEPLADAGRLKDIVAEITGARTVPVPASSR